MAANYSLGISYFLLGRLLTNLTKLASARACPSLPPFTFFTPTSSFSRSAIALLATASSLRATIQVFEYTCMTRELWLPSPIRVLLALIVPLNFACPYLHPHHTLKYVKQLLNPFYEPHTPITLRPHSTLNHTTLDIY